VDAPRDPAHRKVRDCGHQHSTGKVPKGSPDHVQDAPHACYEGVVYLGQLVIGDDGEEEEVFFPVLCRRCSGDDEDL
jgi:hypothetical protein